MEAYQKIQQIYNKEVKDIFHGDVVVEEKLDGSQFRIEIDPDGAIRCGSHHQELGLIDSMFKRGVDAALKQFEGYKPELPTFIYCEYFGKQKQNTVAYKRVPDNHLVIFDIKMGDKWLRPEDKALFAVRFGLE